MISRACVGLCLEHDGARSYRRGFTGFLRRSLLGLGEITEKFRTECGAFRFTCRPCCEPLHSLGYGSVLLRNTTLTAEPSVSLFIRSHSLILMFEDRVTPHNPLRLLMLHSSTLFPESSFRYLNSCVKHMYAWSALLSVYLGEKFTHPTMSQGLRASATLWCDQCCFVFLPFEATESSRTMITHSSSHFIGRGSSKICLSKKDFHWKVNVQDVSF